MHSLQWTASRIRSPLRVRTKTHIWPALVVTVIVHALLIFLPLKKYRPLHTDSSAEIQVQLIPLLRQNTTLETTLLPDMEAVQGNPDSPLIEAPQITDQQSSISTPALQESEQLPSQKSEQTLDQLRDRILSSPFIVEEPDTDNIFGKPRVDTITKVGFHYPARESMITMLSPPVPDLPFDFTPGLIKFSYDPGVRGDMQRFFDRITPEFGWTTKYGTKVECAFVLIFVACGWGR